MTDREAEELLELLYKYVTDYDDARNMDLREIVEDLAMSMDVTSDRADYLRREMEGILG